MMESSLLERTEGYIGGNWVGANAPETFPVVNPATGEELARVQTMGKKETEEAVAAASKALRLADPATLAERRDWLEGVRDALKAEKDEIGRILCLEHGKPLKEAVGEVDYAAGFFD